MGAAAAAEHHRRQQLHPPAQRRGRVGSLPGARRSARSATTTPVRPLHLQRSLPLRAGLVRRRPRRHLDVGLGPQLPELARAWSAAGPRCSARASSTRRASRTRAAPTTARRIRSARTATRRSASRACRTIRVVVGGIVGIDIDRPHPHRLAELHAEVPAHQPVAVARTPSTWLNGRHQVKFGADLMLPMNNEYFDVAPTRGNLRFTRPVHRQRLRRLPARLRAARAADQRVRRRPAAVVARRSSRRTTGSVDRQADGEPRPALRLHDAGDRERQQPMANFDPAGAGALVFATDGSLEDRALVNPDKNNFAPRLGAIYKLDDRTIIRGGFGMFYNQFERIGSEDQLALNPPGLRNIDVSRAGLASTAPVLLHAGRLPGRTSSIRRTSSSAACMLRAADRNSPRTMVQQFGGGIERQIGAQFRGLGRRRRLDRPTTSRCCATSTSRCRARSTPTAPLPYPDFGNVQWREMTGEANYKGVDLSFEKRFEQGLQLPRVVHARRGARSGAGAPERVIRAAAERARPRVVGRAERLRHPPPLRRQLHRRAAVRRRQAVRCRTASPARSSAAGWSAASTARAPAGRSR